MLAVKGGIVETFEHRLGSLFKAFAVGNELLEHFESRPLFGAKLVE